MLQKYRLTIILKALRLAKTTYYRWLNHIQSKRDKFDEVLKTEISDIWENNYKVYGYPRITVALKRRGFNVGTNRVYRLMKELGIRSLMARRFKKPGTHVDYAQRPNLIRNNPNRNIWRADITYIGLKPGTWVYMSSILDEQTRKVVNFDIDRHMTAELVVKTFKGALEHSEKPDYLHSDMGSQYTSGVFEALLATNKVKHSYSRKGYPYDNGPIEAFHSLLERKFTFQTKFKNYFDLVLRTENYMYWFGHERIRMAG